MEISVIYWINSLSVYAIVANVVQVEIDGAFARCH